LSRHSFASITINLIAARARFTWAGGLIDLFFQVQGSVANYQAIALMARAPWDA
jgi:hypothetical protein